MNPNELAVSPIDLELGDGLEQVDFLKENEPNWGFRSREKVGLELELFGENEKLAAMTRGESLGDPNTPMPDLNDRVKGAGGGGEAIVVEEGDADVVEYESLTTGPEAKLVDRESERSEGWWVVVEKPERKGKLKIVMGILARRSNGWWFCCSCRLLLWSVS